MKLRKNLAGIVLMGALALSGCGEEASIKSAPKIETIGVLPLSVEQGTSYAGDSISTVIDVDGEKVLAQTDQYNQTYKYTDAAALIRSEMNDGDMEEISIVGSYGKGKKFRIHSVTVNGYTVDFQR